jgi:5-methylcytosine-specific restriction endonuclease McrA
LLTLPDDVLDRWVKSTLSRVDTRTRRRCLVCKRPGAPRLGVHLGRCQFKLVRELEQALALSRTPEMRRFRRLRGVWASRAAGRHTRPSFVQFRARWDFYGGKCWMCGGLANQVDHVIPLSRGGSNWPANLRPACRSCKGRKRDRAPSDFDTAVRFAEWCRRLDSRPELVMRLRKEGRSLREVASMVGMSHESVRRLTTRTSGSASLEASGGSSGRKGQRFRKAPPEPQVGPHTPRPRLKRPDEATRPQTRPLGEPSGGADRDPPARASKIVRFRADGRSDHRNHRDPRTSCD